MFHGLPMAAAIRPDGLPIGVGLQLGLGLSACPQDLNSPSENTHSMLPRPGYELPEVPDSLSVLPHWTPSVDAEFSRLLALQSSGRLSSTTDADDDAAPSLTFPHPTSRRPSLQPLQSRRPSAVVRGLVDAATTVTTATTATTTAAVAAAAAPGTAHSDADGEPLVGRGISDQIYEVLEADTDDEDDDVSSESESITPETVMLSPSEFSSPAAAASPTTAAIDAAAASTSAAIFERWIEQVLRENTPQKPAMPRATAHELASYTVTALYRCSDEPEECCICLDTYEEGVSLGVLPCCHKYHRSCVDRWLSQCRMCPICKRDIVN